MSLTTYHRSTLSALPHLLNSTFLDTERELFSVVTTTEAMSVVISELFNCLDNCTREKTWYSDLWLFFDDHKGLFFFTEEVAEVSWVIRAN